jgi:hypothetical protein
MNHASNAPFRCMRGNHRKRNIVPASRFETQKDGQTTCVVTQQRNSTSKTFSSRMLSINLIWG